MASALVGGVKEWDEVQQNFDHYLSRLPEYGNQIGPDFFGLPIWTRGDEIIVVYYHVNEAEKVIELLEAHLF